MKYTQDASSNEYYMNTATTLDPVISIIDCKALLQIIHGYFRLSQATQAEYIHDHLRSEPFCTLATSMEFAVAF